jgi:signal transduction histidine kinase
VRELERATRELSRAQEQVVRGERLAMVGRLSAGIAHEVGNPLAAIVGLTEVLKEGGLEPDEHTEFVDRIGREAQRIHRTVRELLDYARAAPSSDKESDLARSGENPGVATGDAAEAIEQVMRLLRPQKDLKDLGLATRVGDGIPAVPLATDRLVQVVLNLVLNAADAVRRAGGSSIAIELESRGDRVVLAVEDDGTGIPDDVRERIFEPFFTTKPAGEGTGLGLATSAAIIEQAGGTIRALSRNDSARGTRMQVDLPRRGTTLRQSRESLVG